MLENTKWLYLSAKACKYNAQACHISETLAKEGLFLACKTKLRYHVVSSDKARKYKRAGKTTFSRVIMNNIEND